MERLTSRESRSSGLPGVSCTHFRGGDCEAVQGRCSDGCPWEEAAWERLAAYEDTGLKPEDIDALQKREQGLAEMLVNVSCGCAVPYTRLAELAQAEKDGRLVMLPDAKYTDADGEKALQKAMWVCGNTNNPVTRYTADAIAEKLCREARDENPPLTLEELREMDGEPVWIIPMRGSGGFCTWMLVDAEYELCREAHGEMAVFENCGKTWLAYRRKPEEG